MTDTETNREVLMLNASTLKLSACLKRFYLSLLSSGKELSSSSIAIVYGEAFHVFVADYVKNGDTFNAIKKAVSYFNDKIQKDGIVPDYRNVDHLEQICLMFAAEYIRNVFVPVELNGEPVIEKTFMFNADYLLPSSARDNYALVVYGTVDLLARYNDELIIVDYKTTSVFNRNSYLDGYRMSPQLLFYIYSMKKLGFKVDGAVISAIFINKNPLLTKFQQSPIIRFDEATLSAFEEMVKMKLNQLLPYLEANTIPPPEGIVTNVCNSNYGVCPIYDECSNRLI